MSQITIVGVEGSGKTVLMAAMGELYERPDANGYFLSPESALAFGFVKTQMAIMHQGRWPAATMTDSIQHFHWSLFRKQPGKPQKIADVSFLDFAGEIYRLAFGEHSESEAIEYQKEIDSLKKYVRNADTLIVLVNLSDIINGSVSNPRTREAMWLTKSILDFAEKSGHPKRSAIVFSQSDTYRDIIEGSGGPRATLQRYLPHVANVYEGEVFAVSAVDKTEIDDNGLTIPARDFSSIGLQNLMNWIVNNELRMKEEREDEIEQQKMIEAEELHFAQKKERKKLCLLYASLLLIFPLFFLTGFFTRSHADPHNDGFIIGTLVTGLINGVVFFINLIKDFKFITAKHLFTYIFLSLFIVNIIGLCFLNLSLRMLMWGTGGCIFMTFWPFLLLLIF